MLNDLTGHDVYDTAEYAARNNEGEFKAELGGCCCNGTCAHRFPECPDHHVLVGSDGRFYKVSDDC